MQSAQANTDVVPFHYEEMSTISEDTQIPDYMKFSDLKTIEQENILITKSLPEIINEKQIKNNDSFTINASAYTASADECGNSKGITASGEPVRVNHTLACPPEYAFGTQIEIEGHGTFTCKDRGGAIKNDHFDIYMETKAEAFAFGRRTLTAYIVS